MLKLCVAFVSLAESSSGALSLNWLKTRLFLYHWDWTLPVSYLPIVFYDQESADQVPSTSYST